MPYQAVVIANEFIHMAAGTTLSPMKLQKLVYYAHGWHLALRDSPLLEERIEAWQFGPVIPELYREFKHYGDAEIGHPATRTDYRTMATYEPRVEDDDQPENRHALEVIRSVWSAYGDYSATKLSNATHKPGSPWSATYIPGRRSMVIPNELIKAYFKAL